MYPSFFPMYWLYPFWGPAPPSPVVVSTVPEYFGGRPTPPPSPPKWRLTTTIDDYAPCPPTPYCVPVDADQDQRAWSSALGSEISQSASSEPHISWSPSELDRYTSFVDPLTDKTLDNSRDQAAYSEPVDGSDHLLYARETYACPSPILIMMQRATLDTNNLGTQPVNPYACIEPLKLFSLTGGRTPLTGLHDLDQQSLKYYAKRPHPSLLRNVESSFAYRYSMSCIQALQRSLQTDWSSVYPAPIPPVIIRSCDLVGPYDLRPRTNGFAFVVPTQDSFWATICQRGIDMDFRPINPWSAVATCMVEKGAARYFPQHTVASEFAVNVFLEIAGSAARSIHQCEYLGAYVLQTLDGLVLDHATWVDIDPRAQRAIYERAPHCFQADGYTSLGWPQLPCIRFFYYKWDRHIVGLADEPPHSMLTLTPDIVEHLAAGDEVDSSDDTDDSDT